MCVKNTVKLIPKGRKYTNHIEHLGSGIAGDLFFFFVYHMDFFSISIAFLYLHDFTQSLLFHASVFL